MQPQIYSSPLKTGKNPILLLMRLEKVFFHESQLDLDWWVTAVSVFSCRKHDPICRFPQIDTPSWREMPRRSYSSRPCPQRWRWSQSRRGGRRSQAGTAPPGGRSAGRTGIPGTSRRFGLSSSAGLEPGRSSPGGRQTDRWVWMFFFIKYIHNQRSD